MHILGAESEEADELRQNSPFAGTLPEAERLAILAAHRRFVGVPGPAGGSLPR